MTLPVIAVCNHSQNLLLLFNTLLTRGGFQVATYLQNRENIEALAARLPALILIGYFDGYLEEELSFVQALRRHPLISDVPLLVCTSPVLEGEGETLAGDTPDNLVLANPFDLEELLAAVHHALPDETA